MTEPSTTAATTQQSHNQRQVLTPDEASLVAEVLDERAVRMRSDASASAVLVADAHRHGGDQRARSLRLVQDLARAEHLAALAARLRSAGTE